MEIIKTRRGIFHYTFVIYSRNLDYNYKIWATFTTSSYTPFSGNNNNNTANLRQYKLQRWLSNVQQMSNLSRPIIEFGEANSLKQRVYTRKGTQQYKAIIKFC